jgi:hypothetical protein
MEMKQNCFPILLNENQKLKNLKEAIPRSNGKFNLELKKIQNEDQMFLLKSRTRQHLYKPKLAY